MKQTIINELNAIQASCRDIEELNKVTRTYKLALESISSQLNGIWIVIHKIDRLFSEVIDKKYE